MLLALGLCGSMVVIWQLVLSAEMILQREIEPATNVSNMVQESEPEFPIAVTDTCLIARYPVLYEGPYIEDGSNDYVVDVASIVLFNTARTGIEYATVVLQWDSGEYVFEAHMIPPRQAVMVLDKTRQKFQEHRWTSCVGTQKMGNGEWLEQQELVVELTGDIEITVENTTDKQLHDIRIYYKSYLPSDRLYIGGITYCAGIETLEPGTCTKVQPYRYVKDYSKIFRTTYRQ